MYRVEYKLLKMADPGFPSQHTTTTTVTNSEIMSILRYDNTYFYTLPGKLKIAQIVSNICIYYVNIYSCMIDK